MVSKKLSREDWILAGFRALTLHGPSALKAEALARDLKTTKGSFYWHFKDVADFHAKMLALWRTRAYEQTVTELKSTQDAKQRLIRLGEMATAGNQNESHGGRATESAIRAWAQSNDNVRQAVTEIDHLRLTYIETLLAELGVQDPKFARLIYGAFIGMESLSNQDGHNNAPDLAALIQLIMRA